MKMDEVLELLRTGEWELGSSFGIDGSYTRIQKGCSGKGGEVRTVHGNTFNALLKRGFIERVGSEFPTQFYRLKERKNT